MCRSCWAAEPQGLPAATQGEFELDAAGVHAARAAFTTPDRRSCRAQCQARSPCTALASPLHKGVTAVQAMLWRPTRTATKVASAQASCCMQCAQPSASRIQVDSPAWVKPAGGAPMSLKPAEQPSRLPPNQTAYLRLRVSSGQAAVSAEKLVAGVWASRPASGSRGLTCSARAMPATLFRSPTPPFCPSSAHHNSRTAAWGG